MTTASKFTLARVFMIPLFMVCLYLSYDITTVSGFVWMIAALCVFILASVTDAIDGHIARKYNQVSDFGKFLDPLADKLLVISAMCIFCEWGIFPAWALMIVLAREFAVTGLRLVAVDNGRVIAAAWSGKVKTACTMVALCVLIVLWSFERFALIGINIPANVCTVLDAIVRWLVIGVIVLTTLWSGVEYFIKNWDVFNFKK